MNKWDLPRKADIAERAGDLPTARHLRKWALREGVPVPERKAPRLPALPFSAAELDGMGIPHETNADGTLSIVARAVKPGMRP